MHFDVEQQHELIKMHVEKGSFFPTPEELSKTMSIATEQCMDMLRIFIQKGFLYIEECEDQHGIKSEKYSLEPLWSKLFDHLEMAEKKKREEQHEGEQKSLYTIFEEEFGLIICTSWWSWSSQTLSVSHSNGDKGLANSSSNIV